VTESDWKTFKKIKEIAIEKFCTLSLAEFREAMDDESVHIHNRYLLNYKLVQNRDKQMALLFDEHSRSKASLQLLAIRGEGLADEVLISKLSEEFLRETDPKNHNY
tara:strand:- start:136 stop:453 length:318 start_codon:yes stop_codon:yes gene_type:complete